MLGKGSFSAHDVYGNRHGFGARSDATNGIGGGAVKDALSYSYVIATGIFR